MKNRIKKHINPLAEVTIKFTILAVIIGMAIMYADKKGFFNPDETNNHTLRKWDSFYELTSKQTTIDIMLFGNSHLYTGINPKNLSLALGVNAFIYASPGTSIADSYYCLKEAVKECKPKLVVMETFGMNDFNPYQLKGSHLSDQMKSFSARRDFETKICSTPCLFSVDNYFYAWSTTIRNHDYLFTNWKQLKKNRKIRSKTPKKENKLYLGRYVRFRSGIAQEVLKRYKKEGAPVKGNEYTYSKYTEMYVEKIVEFCNKEGIELIFLTLPMYEKHISDYHIWQTELAKVLNRYPNKWLNLQKMPECKDFGVFAFENTYRKNQHMTYNGSLLATYKLADFVNDSINVKLPERQKDIEWHKMFYGSEGYFENYTPSKNDKNNYQICHNQKLKNTILKSCIVLSNTNKKTKKIIAKLDKKTLKNIDFQNTKLRVLLKFHNNGKELVAPLDLLYDRFHQPKNECLYSSRIKPVDVKGIVDGAIVRK